MERVRRDFEGLQVNLLTKTGGPPLAGEGHVRLGQRHTFPFRL
jgi:hypothetical protein